MSAALLRVRQLLSPLSTACRPILQWRAYAREVALPSDSSNERKRSPFIRIDGLYKTYKPITPGLRHLRRPLTPYLFKGRPLRQLTLAKRSTGGRNSDGRITCRGRGGGHKRRVRLVDFMRRETGIHDVIRIEYDPNRSAHIALLKSRNPDSNQPWSYILAPEALRAGQTVESFREGVPDGLVEGYSDPGRKTKKSRAPAASDAEEMTSNLMVSSGVKNDKQESEVLDHYAAAEASLALGQMRALTLQIGNVLPLRLIPSGTQVHCIALNPDRKMILLRSAGSYGTVVGQAEKGVYCQVKLQSGEIRKIHKDCPATVGRVGNVLHHKVVLGKAGRSRWLGRRPKVRGMAMNAVDHPHGGGRGKSKGNKHPRSPWGWLTKGKRTRKPGPKGPKGSNQMVVKERPRGVEKRESRL